MSQVMTGSKSSSRTSWKKEKLKRSLAPYLFVLPNFVIFLTFIVIPAFVGFVYSFHEYDGLNEMEFLGLQNYAAVLANGEFWASLGRTGLYAAVVVPGIYALSLGIALLLIREVRLKGLFRASIYWPTMISYIIVGLTWKWIFGDSFGILNHILNTLGFGSIGWLTDPFYANLSVIIATLWSRVGFFMVIFIAGLQSIPVDMYEASSLDGASRWRTFRDITLPMLKPTSLLVFMVALIDAFKAYPLMFALTGGGPGKETTFIVQYIYEIGFSKQELGMASAMSVILFVIIGAFTALQFRLSKGGAD
ncbi:carbohydrate ABC transporter permease [Paenibacillus sp. FSL K6-1230]|uniref:carbohydrate ABC transporter permease n=1 Tax=Paenibacillus sp. FSL K6-1230 TaxID=2921603 RepID=UPI00039F8DD5